MMKKISVLALLLAAFSFGSYADDGKEDAERQRKPEMDFSEERFHSCLFLFLSMDVFVYVCFCTTGIFSCRTRWFVGSFRCRHRCFPAGAACSSALEQAAHPAYLRVCFCNTPAVVNSSASTVSPLVATPVLASIL